jgi:tetratricopeptide (TPR) repeat protein
MLVNSKRLLAVSTLVLGLWADSVRADDIYLRSGKTAELKLSNITVRMVKDGELHYTANSRDSHRPIVDISRLELTGETAFNAAEKAFSDANVAKDAAAAKPKYAEAVSGYTNTMNSTNKPWLKDYVSLRMQVAAPKSGRFDVALDAWKVMVEKDPLGAAKAKPSIDDIDPKSQYLTNAAKALQVWANGSPKPEARRTFLDLLYDIQLKLGDVENANKTLEARVAAGGTPEEQAEVAVKLAMSDLAAKRYDGVLDRGGKVNAALLNDAARGDLVYALAEAKSSKMAPTSPPDAWKDLAIEYMRAVAGAPQGPHAANALLRVGEIHETLKEPDTAVKIYQAVAREYAATPAAQAAQKNLERLGKTARNG